MIAWKVLRDTFRRHSLKSALPWHIGLRYQLMQTRSVFIGVTSFLAIKGFREGVGFLWERFFYMISRPTGT